MLLMGASLGGRLMVGNNTPDRQLPLLTSVVDLGSVSMGSRMYVRCGVCSMYESSVNIDHVVFGLKMGASSPGLVHPTRRYSAFPSRVFHAGICLLRWSGFVYFRDGKL